MRGDHRVTPRWSDAAVASVALWASVAHGSGCRASVVPGVRSPVLPPPALPPCFVWVSLSPGQSGGKSVEELGMPQKCPPGAMQAARGRGAGEGHATLASAAPAAPLGVGRLTLSPSRPAPTTPRSGAAANPPAPGRGVCSLCVSIMWKNPSDSEHAEAPGPSAWGGCDEGSRQGMGHGDPRPGARPQCGHLGVQAAPRPVPAVPVPGTPRPQSRRWGDPVRGAGGTPPLLHSGWQAGGAAPRSTYHLPAPPGPQHWLPPPLF